jgi:subtilase family serine protease
MTKLFKVALPLLAFAVSACSAGGSPNMPAATTASTGAAKHTIRALSGPAPQWLANRLARPECPQIVGKPTCLALRVTAVPAACNPSNTCGLTPQQIEQAYNLSKSLNKGAGTKVALIEIGDYSAATADLATYRKQFNLGTAKLIRYNELGQTKNYPSSCLNAGWCVETALDIDMISVTCPKCTILVMEAGLSSDISDLETAEQEAVKLGAKILSNSWICYADSQCGDPNFDNYFDTNGVTYLAASGDFGYNNIGAPSALSTVIGVGGTQLTASGSNFAESVWNDAGAGCANSAIVGVAIAKPSWQSDPDCSNRTDTDIAAEAGCSPGVAVYSQISGGWVSECGTSAATPLLAGIVALAGNGSKLSGEYVWSLSPKEKTKLLNTISTGNDGSCGGSYLCTAGTNQFSTYSGPAGWGSPKSIKAL